MAQSVVAVGRVPEESLPSYLTLGDVALYPMEDNLINRAKSPVKVMRVKAPQGATLYFRITGADGGAALAALLALVDDGFGEA